MTTRKWLAAIVVVCVFLAAPWLSTLLIMAGLAIGLHYLLFGKLMGAKRWWVLLVLQIGLMAIYAVVSVIAAVFNAIF